MGVLVALAARVASRSTCLLLSQAAGGDAGGDNSKDLRRFDTVLSPAPPGAAGAPGAGTTLITAAQAETAAAARRFANDETASALAAKVGRLRDLLKAHEALDDEGARLQRAVQQQEEQDSLKMIQLFRAQNEAFSAELAEVKAAVEEATMVRMRQENDEALAEVERRISAMEGAHGEMMDQVMKEASAAVSEASNAATAETEARLGAAHNAAMAAERDEQSARISKLDLEVRALSTVLSHNTMYKRVSHATHQLTTSVLMVRSMLAGKSTPAAAALATLPSLATKLGDDLLVEAFAPLRGKGAERMAKVPTLPQLTKRFDVVAAAGRTAALVPEAEPGLLGHLLASVTSALTLRAAETGHTATSSVFATAEAALLRGDLKHAVATVRTLEGAPAATVSGWLQAAEERLALEQLLALAMAECTVATMALAPY